MRSGAGAAMEAAASTEEEDLEAEDFTVEGDLEVIVAAVSRIAAGDLRGDTEAVTRTAGAGMEVIEERRQRVTRAAEAQTERADIPTVRGITHLRQIVDTGQMALIVAMVETWAAGTAPGRGWDHSSRPTRMATGTRLEIAPATRE